MKMWLVPLALLSLLFITGGGEAQIRNCGDIDILFLNPDLQPGSDNKIHASGDFFAQFQAIGDQADQIETFGFSFGPQVVDVGEDICELPSEAWFTGQALINYRADLDESDGFFINLQTPLVPDGAYAAAVHAYDANDKELARFWAPAVVENCDTGVDPAGLVERCTDDDAQQQRNDATAPWPILLPGDGAAPADGGLTIEFAEPLSDLRVTLNGEDITDQLEQWGGRLWDNDLVPGYGPNGLAAGNPVTQECTQAFHTCSELGVAYRWSGRDLVDADVYRVEATDLNGNSVTKDIHVGSGVTGGAISADFAILDWQVDSVEQDAKPGDKPIYKFTLSNRGTQEGHPIVTAEGPPGFEFEWFPAHKPVPAGESTEQELTVTLPSLLAEGRYQINATVDYTQAGAPNQLEMLLFVNIINGTSQEDLDAQNEPEEVESPGAPTFLALVVMAAVVASRKS
ncbi:MAG: hypothetical protein ACPHK8_01950 [Thermoplasmatota archaeon]